eukprot:1179967-Prorocentrum_minimum.AAC.7
MDSGPQGADSGPQGVDSGPQGVDSGPQRVDLGPQGVVWSSEDAESGPQHRLQTANKGVQCVEGVHGLPNDHRLPTTVMLCRVRGVTTGQGR